MPRNKATVVSPDRIRLRLIQQVPAGTPGAFQDATFGFWWITTASRGLNGGGGFIQVEHASTLNDSSEMTVQLPPSGSDGRDNRDRLYLFNGSADPQGSGMVAYMPGDEWVELIRGVNEVVQVATPVSETSSPESLSVVCRDATAILKKTRETAAGFWNHAPRDVFEHYTRAFQTVLAEDFQNPAAYLVLNSSSVNTSTDGRWKYRRVSNVVNGLLGLISDGFEASITQASALITDAGPNDHGCWRAECSIASASFTPVLEIPSPSIRLTVSPTSAMTGGQAGYTYPVFAYALVISPGVGAVQVTTANHGAFTFGTPTVPTIASAVEAVSVTPGFSTTTEVYYKVTAVNASGETTPSPTVVCFLNAGSGAVVTVNPVDGATSYRVYRASGPWGPPDPGTEVFIGVISAPNRTFLDDNSFTGTAPPPTTHAIAGYYHDVWPVNAAGLLDSQNHLQPPYTMAIEARERWVHFYLDGQLIAVTPRIYADPISTSAQGLVASVALAGASGDTAQVDYVVLRKTTPPMNGGQAGDYRLPSVPSPGGLQGAYYDQTLAYGTNGTTSTGAQITQYNAAPPTFQPGTVRTDSGIYFQDGFTFLPPPVVASVTQVGAGSGYIIGSVVYYKVTAVNAVGGETTPSAEASFSITANNVYLSVLINPVAGATGYKIYVSTNAGTTRSGVAGAGSGAERYAGTVSSPDGSGNWAYLDQGTPATTSVSPPTTNTAAAATSLSLGWFPAALGAARQAYVRWTGSILLPLGAGTAVTFKLPSTNISQALWVGQTRKGESICCSDSGDLATQVGADTLHKDFPGETIRQTSTDVRTALGSVSGWYPIVFEFIWRAADIATNTVGFTYNTGTGDVVPSPYVLSPYGCFTDQVAQSDSHFDVLQTTIGQSFAYKWICQPKPLEDPGFPGIIVPKVRVGRDTDYVLDETVAVNPQETSKAEDNATTDLAQAQGLGGSNSGGLTAEAFNFAAMGSHPFVLTESESLPATTQMGLLVLQMETLLALRSDAWQSVSADSSGQRSMQDSWPLTGALAEFDWGPGDGLRIELPSVGVIDATPRQIMALKRMFYQDGVGTNSAAFQDRPRDFAHTMRRFVRQFYSSRRQFQGQLTYVPGTQAVAPAYSMAPLPVDTTLVRQATLTILSKTDVTTTFAVEVNGFATGQTILAPGVLDISNAIGRNNGVEPQMLVRLTSPSADCQASYILSLLVLVNTV